MSTNKSPEAAFVAPFAERIIAAIIDLLIVLGLTLLPQIGWMLGLIYFLMRDSMPILKGQSFGKHLMRLKVITNPGGDSLVKHPEKSIIRGLVTLVPILNLIDVFYFFVKGCRLADIWAQTAVVFYEDVDEDKS